jgi:hypothetical protein
MEKCKNNECKNETVGKNKYCSLKCRNIYVNKYLRDYSKNVVGLSGEKKYYLNPKFCLRCNEIIKYEQRENKLFCSKSCSASFTNSNRIISEKTKQKISTKAKERAELSPNHKKEKLKKCFFCEKEFTSTTRKKSCSNECLKESKRKNMSEFQKYKMDCLFNFNLSDYENEFDFDLVRKYGWYKPKNRGNNLEGVSRDHMYSIKDGFDNKVEQYLIAHPANCKLILQRENSSKYKKSSITLDELKNKIKEWNKKYKLRKH